MARVGTKSIVGGEIPPGTYFSLEPANYGRRLTRLSIREQGYRHDVGMGQWGAIGQARVGQDCRKILRAYYPGIRTRISWRSVRCV